MYHFVAEESPKPLQLSARVSVPGHVRQYLKRFQLDALRFLHAHFARRDFCILNDESGLGKSATMAVFLGAALADHDCLIVVRNDENAVVGWQFHLSMLSNLPVAVISDADAAIGAISGLGEKPARVYVARWCTLRALGDLSKFNFGFVIVDNRGQMLSNNFCSSMLIKHYEKHVNILISSVDVTSDIKLLHTVLRLGGRLDPQYEGFRAFEERFKLPDTRDLVSKRLDLEQYFLKREFLNDYCKDYRLRRYRHQFEEALPLVEPERYRANLDLWRTTQIASHHSLEEPSEDMTAVGTEELFRHFQAFRKDEELIHPEVAKIINDAHNLSDRENGTADEFEEPVVMSPLLFISDSEQEEVADGRGPAQEDTDCTCSDSKIEVVDLVSESELTTENLALDDSSERQKTRVLRKTYTDTETTSRRSQQPISAKRSDRSEDCSTGPSRATRASDGSATKDKGEVKIRQMRRSYVEGVTVGNTTAVQREGRRTRSKRTASIALASQKVPGREKNTRTTPDAGVLREETQRKPKRVRERRANIAAEAPKRALRTAHRNSGDKAVAKAGARQKSTKTQSAATTEAIAPEGHSTPTPSKPKSGGRTPKRVQTAAPLPKKETRSMQRMTRSGNVPRNLLKSLDLVGPRRKRQPRPQVCSAKNTETTAAAPTTECRPAAVTKGATQPVQTNGAKPKIVAPSRASEMSVISSSDYEDIECGQKLSSGLSSENGSVAAGLTEKAGGPAAAAYGLLPSISLFSDSEVVFVPPPPSLPPLRASKDKHHQHDVIVLSGSSLDDGSVRSEAAKKGRRTRVLMAKKVPTSSARHRGHVPAKGNSGERPTNRSPDLFSNYSDLGLTHDEIPFNGFKIFGSEVKQFQQQHVRCSPAAVVGTRDRSCLDILEKMFQPRNGIANREPGAPIRTQTAPRRAMKSPNAQPIVPVHPIDAINSNAATEIEAAKTSNKANKVRVGAKSATDCCGRFKARPEPAMARGAAPEDEEIFEISNNGTFGSVLRINSSGHISPVQQQHPLKAAQSGHTQQQHNKITNYLIGSSTPATTPDDEDLGSHTPRSARTQLLAGATRKSPKSKSTQATKLTKWFLRNLSPSASAEAEAAPRHVTHAAARDAHATAAAVPVSGCGSRLATRSAGGAERKHTQRRSAAPVKRRRLDLSDK